MSRRREKQMEPMRIEVVRVPVEPDYMRYAGDLLELYKKSMNNPEFMRKFEEWKKKKENQTNHEDDLSG